MSFAANPRAPKPDPSKVPQEPTGPIASDSLAAESIKQDGAFAANKNAVPLSVKGGSSTLNTTDTSGASVLHAASSGAEREEQDAQGAGPDERGTTGLKLDSLGTANFDGSHSVLGYAGGPGNKATGVSSSASGAPAGASDFGSTTVSAGGDSSSSSNIRSGSAVTGAGQSDANNSSSKTSSSGPAAGTGVRPQVSTAPNYTGAVTGSLVPEGTYKPKGANLDDADKSGSIPETKTFTGDVGGVHDPGRLAERDFEGVNTDPNPDLRESANSTSNGQGGGQYGVLGNEMA